jgi:hypothetical protein
LVFAEHFVSFFTLSILRCCPLPGRCMPLHPSAWKWCTDGWNVPSVTLSDCAGLLVFGEPLR